MGSFNNYLVKTSLAVMMSTALAFTTVSCTKQPEEQKKVEIQEKTLEQKAEEGYIAPDFTLKNLEDKDVSLSDYDNKVLILNFWSLLCGPCIAEMPDLHKFKEEYKDRDLEVITLNCWGDEKNKIEKFLEKNKLTFEVLIDKGDKISDLYNLKGIPATFILDKDKRVLKKVEGMYDFTKPAFKKWVDGLLKGDVKEFKEAKRTAMDELNARRKMLKSVFERPQNLPKRHMQQHSFYIFDKNDDAQIEGEELKTVVKEFSIKPSKKVLNYGEFMQETKDLDKDEMAAYIVKNIDQLSKNDLLDLLKADFKSYLETWPDSNKSLAEKISKTTDPDERKKYEEQLVDSKQRLGVFDKGLAFYVTDKDGDLELSCEEYNAFAERFGVKTVKQGGFVSPKEFMSVVGAEEHFKTDDLIKYVMDNYSDFTRQDVLDSLE